MAIAGYIGLRYAAKHVLAYSVICPHRVDIGRYKDVNPGKVGLCYDVLTVVTKDSIALKGWFVHAMQSPVRGSIFILHGIADSKFSQQKMMELLCNNGFNCILFDHRAHGESGGKFCTFGYFEKYDYSTVLDTIMADYPMAGSFGILGHSLGAAISVQVMAYDQRFCCGVIESSFADLRQIAHDYLKQKTSVPLPFIADMALAESERIAHFQVDSVSPANAALRIVKPVMFVHGLKDERISPEYGRSVYDNIQSPVKIWYPIPDAGHNNLSKFGGEEYQRKIVEFFKKNM
jgi:pimeloyl-ACP methyl ester carboxylesterase